MVGDRSEVVLSECSGKHIVKIAGAIWVMEVN